MVVWLVFACAPVQVTDPVATSQVTEDSDDTSAGGELDTALDTALETATTVWGIPMVFLPGGTFTMGGGVSDPEDDYRDHSVTLTHDFWIGATEVTRGQWEAYGANAGWRYDSVQNYPCTTSTTASDCPADSV